MLCSGSDECNAEVASLQKKTKIVDILKFVDVLKAGVSHLIVLFIQSNKTKGVIKMTDSVV